MQFIFWLALISLFYAYIGYPVLLAIMCLRRRPRRSADHDHFPAVSIIIPVHNEERVIRDKISNLLSLEYPRHKTEIIIVSDASDDGTNEIVSSRVDEGIRFFVLPNRKGKANALNHGLKEARHDIVVFSDASIMLEKESLSRIVRRFHSSEIGCVSGEDHIGYGSEEGLYGKYELLLRNLESRVHSIVGASGSFYAQRRLLCPEFQEGMAPDFLSVLKTIEEGYIAVTEPTAIGFMKSASSPQAEFVRKCRTVLRGMHTLFSKRHLINPARYGIFAFELISHKIIRWLVPIFMLLVFFCNFFLVESAFYICSFAVQCTFYLLAIIGFIFPSTLQGSVMIRLPAFFCYVNIAILYAWYKYLIGMRLEIWEPTRRGTL